VKEAEEHMSLKQPFLVFLDNNLPDGLGIDFMTRIKSNYSDVQVVMITGDGSEELKHQALTEGCIGFLEKPFSYLRVSELLEQAMHTQHF
jgi:DNA-binding NtrC family response regulator